MIAVAASSRAANFGRSFTMQANEPLMVGNTLLPDGRYIWTLADSSSNRHIVEITNQATRHVQATILAIPKYREVVTPKNELQFWETPAGRPRAIRAWFSPGDNFGQEFPYPQSFVLTTPVILTPPVPRTLSLTPNTGSPLSAPPQRIAKPLSQKPRPKAMASISPRRVWPEGSWAVITESSAPAQAPAHKGSLWQTLRGLPLTATLAPLVGLIGVASLTLYFLSYLKRKKPLSVR